MQLKRIALLYSLLETPLDTVQRKYPFVAYEEARIGLLHVIYSTRVEYAIPMNFIGIACSALVRACCRGVGVGSGFHEDALAMKRETLFNFQHVIRQFGMFPGLAGLTVSISQCWFDYISVSFHVFK